MGSLWDRVKATIDGANIMIGTELPDGPFLGTTAQAFFNQFPNTFNKNGMGPNGLGTSHFHSEPVTNPLGFFIEIEQNFHVIRQKSDRCDDDGLLTSFAQFANIVADIWF